MTPDKNFRISKRTKTIVALMCKSNEDRGHLRRILIDGQICEEQARKQSLKAKGNKTKDLTE